MPRFLKQYDYIFILLIFIGTITVLGFITPDYNHLVHTISMLGYGKYKHFLTTILLITSAFFMYKHFQLSRLPPSPPTRTLQQIFLVFSLVLLLVTFFPTNSHNPNKFILSEIGPIAKIHTLTIFSFFLFSPMGIYKLYKTFSQNPIFRQLAKTTLLFGSICFTLTLFWVYSSLLGTLPGLLGFLQKIIILLLLTWLTLVFRHLNRLLYT